VTLALAAAVVLATRFAAPMLVVVAAGLVGWLLSA
jgi:hypothetical protein